MNEESQPIELNVDNSVEKDNDEVCEDCGRYGCSSQYECDREQELNKKKHIKDLENGDLTPEEDKRMLKYCETRCTSSCGNDYDCPHEEDFILGLIENLQVKEIPMFKGTLEALDNLSIIKK